MDTKRAGSQTGTTAGAAADEVIGAISRFFEAAAVLSRVGVITGPDYTGEIAGYLASRHLGAEMIPYRKRRGWDGILDGGKLCLRFTNCPHGRPLSVPDPDDFDHLIVVLGPRCTLRPVTGWSLLFYRFQAEDQLRVCKAGPDSLVMDATAFAGVAPVLEVALPAQGSREERP